MTRSYFKSIWDMNLKNHHVTGFIFGLHISKNAPMWRMSWVMVYKHSAYTTESHHPHQTLDFEQVGTEIQIPRFPSQTWRQGTIHHISDAAKLHKHLSTHTHFCTSMQIQSHVWSWTLAIFIYPDVSDSIPDLQPKRKKKTRHSIIGTRKLAARVRALPIACPG